ncbi:DUF6221 family protein [Streptomyces sp. NBC_01017]|uniref:DUF6221 family protein n=1 Tax=Streptomyces sp. NBC_01017 TaxID=2903721 RepID=UPI00386F3F5C|nr:DUF6221 family protein [Streptomyces sp. NBC_01017]
MTEELVQWLGEQLDEDERTARRAGDSFRQIGETGVIVAAEGDRAEECASANWAGVAEHIVRHDPARVLREIDAKRQILALHIPFRVDGDPWPGCSTCSWRNDMEDLQVQYPCATLRLLALPYADRPGYREEWRP